MELNSQLDKWLAIRAGDRFPDNAVKAMDRGLVCDDNCEESYVGLWLVVYLRSTMICSDENRFAKNSKN